MRKVACVQVVADVPRHRTGRFRELVDSAAYNLRVSLKEAMFTIIPDPIKSRAIPVTRDELKDVLSALELVGGNSWQDQERTRENVGVLLNTLLRRKQKEFT
jgi:hypothetical protein